MPPFDVVVPFYNSAPERLAAARFVLGYCATHVDGTVIVVEQGAQTPDLPIPRGEHVAVEPRVPGFDKGMLFNEGFHRTRAELLLLVDADCLVPASVLRRFRESPLPDADCWTPYGDVFDLSPEQTRSVYQGQDFTGWGSPRAYRCVGGAVMIRRSAYERIGGFEPGFHGWGGEDEAFIWKCRRLLRYERLESERLTHLYHPRSVAEVRDTEAWHRRVAMRDRIASCPMEELERIASEAREHMMGRAGYRLLGSTRCG